MSGELYPYSVRGPADGSCPVELRPTSTCFMAVGLFLVYGTGADAFDCPDGDFATTVVDALMELATSACEATVYGQPSYLKMRTVSWCIVSSPRTSADGNEDTWPEGPDPLHLDKAPPYMSTLTCHFTRQAVTTRFSSPQTCPSLASYSAFTDYAAPTGRLSIRTLVAPGPEVRSNPVMI